MLATHRYEPAEVLFSLDGNKVTAKSTGGFYFKVDLGIVKYPFDVGVGKENFT